MPTPKQLRDAVDRFFGGRNAISRDDAYALAIEIAGITSQGIGAKLKESLEAAHY